MKRLGLIVVICCAIVAGFLVFFPMSASRAYQASTNGEVFLQGNYVEVGIHQAGSFGTNASAPVGFHPKGPSNRLGFVVDMQKDGWVNGTPPQSGDYFTPGSPEEGWSVQWTDAGGSTKHTLGNYGLMGSFQVPMTSLTETSSGDTCSAVWEGTATSGTNQKLKITKTVHFNKKDQFFVITTVITNIGTVNLDAVEFMRNVDPDQEQPITGNFTTSNYVASFDPSSPNKHLVVAKGLTYGITLGLGTIDSRAKVTTGGFSNRNPDAILNVSSGYYTPSPSSPRVADEAISLAYAFGSLAPGQSTSFDYAYILNEGDLNTALGNLAAVTILQPTGTVSGSNVLFQATTNDLPNTAGMQFFVNGMLVGVSSTPDAGGVFQTAFDSTVYPNGTINLKVVATFSNGSTVEKSSTATVDNSGPPISFSTPTSGQVFSGSGIPIGINLLDPSHQPDRVSFFRETASSGSLFLGQDTAAPFASSFSVAGLPEGETVNIKAVAYDSLNRSTTIQVSGVTFTNSPPTIGCAVPITMEAGSPAG